MAKPHSLHRLAASLYNRPHLVDKQTFESVAGYLRTRNSGLMVPIPNDSPEEGDNSSSDMDMEAGVGVINITGPLTYKTTGWEALCGGYSYEMLLEDTEEMLEAGIKTIVLMADSGGGEAYGCFESTDEFRKMLDDAGAACYGYIDGIAASAMYGIICACDTVTINPYGQAGSIGVLICLYNDSEAMKMEGIQRTFVTDGTDKVPFDAEGQFKDSFIEDLQTQVTALGDDFRAHVSKYTGVSTQALKDTQAKVFSANQALELGLVNQIMTRSAFADYVMTAHKGNTQ